MKFARKAGLAIASFLLVNILFLALALGTFQLTLGDRETLKTWVAESGAYDMFVTQVVSASALKASDDLDIKGIYKETLQIAANDAFPPELIQQSTEAFIDGGYDWLEQKNSQIEFEIDLREAKNQFIANLTQAVEERAMSLPECREGEIPTTVDIFTADCLPAVIEPEAIANDFNRELLLSEEFLSDPILNAADLAIEKDGESVPFAEEYASIPGWYRTAKIITWFAVFLSLVCVTAVLVLSTSKRRGAMRLARAFILVGVSTAVGAFLADRTPLSLGGTATGAIPAEDLGKTVIEPFLNRALGGFAGWWYVFAAIFVFVGISILVALFITKPKKAESTPKAQDDANLAEQ